MNSLRELIDYYGSDKNLSNYTEVYEEIFERIRNIELDILEVGIGSLAGGVSNMNRTQIQNYKQGASLRVWRDWFRYSNIWGMDIAEDCMFKEDRINTVLCDSTNKEKIDEVLGNLKFWIIIDDGWHNVEGQKKTFEGLWDRVYNGGIYVIEDIEAGNGSDIYRYMKNKEINYNKNKNGNLLWIHKETKE